MSKKATKEAEKVSIYVFGLNIHNKDKQYIESQLIETEESCNYL